ncbi:MAG: YncE family protein [Polyangia bacterium]
MLRIGTFAVAAALVVAGCDDGRPTPAEVRGCWGSDCAIVTTSHYNADFSGVGTINAVQMSQSKIVRNLDSSLDPDVALDASADKLYVLNRTVGSLRRYDLAKLAIEEEIATGSSAAPNTLSSPFGFWRSDTSTKIYVTLAGNDAAHALGIVDEVMPDAGVTRFIAVPAAASDSDGKPELSSLYACKDSLYVLSQSYTFMGAGISYAEGRIAVIDLKSDTFVGFIGLAGKNPSAIVQDGDDCNKVLVSASSDLTSPPDGTGGIERVDLGARTSLGFVARDSDLQGRPFSIVKVSPKLAYVGMYFDLQPDATGKLVLGSAKVVAWNPSTATTIGDATGKAGFINFVQLGDDNQLYVGVGTFAGMSDSAKLLQGLYVGKADGTLLTTTPIDLGDTPSAIAFQK